MPMRCASKAAESASARLCADAEAETTATDVSSVAEATQPVSLGDAGAGHEDTHVSSQSMSTESHTLLIRKTDPYQRRSNPSRLPSVAWMMLRVVASLVHLMNQMNHRRSEGARGREIGRHSGVGSPMYTTSQRGASPSVGTRRKSGTAMCCVSLQKRKGMDASKVSHGSLVGDDK
uniref:Uncharacterized protein n=1 Tax=Peronospora matthiolae TaxID=2874970 RepID=A0AAV1T6G7_9STRA